MYCIKSHKAPTKALLDNKLCHSGTVTVIIKYNNVENNTKIITEKL